MCYNNHYQNPPLQVVVTAAATTLPAELYSVKQRGLFLAMPEDLNNTGCCTCPGSRKRKSLVASLTELISRPWAARECRVAMNEWDMLVAPRVQLQLQQQQQQQQQQVACQYGNLRPLAAPQGCHREREVVELEGDHSYEHNRRG
ncbi:hypothetical protein K445DRAFT_318119 [Daldinia sp. EC12]|nr:hypothetical protein K445DRAFT_318119 [Daldinia sp. EC12]